MARYGAGVRLLGMECDLIEFSLDAPGFNA